MNIWFTVSGTDERTNEDTAAAYQNNQKKLCAAAEFSVPLNEDSDKLFTDGGDLISRSIAVALCWTEQKINRKFEEDASHRPSAPTVRIW